MSDGDIDDTTTPAGQLWGGRFARDQADALVALSRSEDGYFDLLPHDALASMAHVRELHRARILSEDERDLVLGHLREIIDDHEAGRLSPSPHDEDVHAYLERVLHERAGAVAGKVRAGRSRNDQAANDLRLYLRDRTRTIHRLLLDLVDALADQAADHLHTVAPGFTHLQPGQPVSFAHHLLAHAQSLLRDVDRYVDWDRRAAWSPLGAAALAGSAIAVHPEESARELGYDGVLPNSIDAVSSRDHVAEFLFVQAMVGVNLSRLAEEVSLWTSHQFGWAELDDAWATGSSIMPQKKNPDIAELARGKAGRLLGNLVGMMGAMKGLPLAYNRDLFGDKHEAIDSVQTLEVTLPALTGLVATLQFDRDRMRADATARFTLATEVADALARTGVPFSEAHELTGRLVRLCEERGCDLTDLAADQVRSIDPRIDPEMVTSLSVDSAIAARIGTGGTAIERVREQLAELRDRVAQRRRAWNRHVAHGNHDGR